MKLSTRSRYGLRLLLEIARSEGIRPVPLSQVAKEQNISLKYLEKIAGILKQAGYLQGKRGPSGGYRLSLDPEEIHLGDLIQKLEGNLELVQCWMSEQTCPRVKECKTRRVWEELRSTISSKLNDLTLQDLLQESGPICFTSAPQDRSR
ncbi:MAG: RrF2 family transcriptional regulator [Desulfohalobiaceae bacterium]